MILSNYQPKRVLHHFEAISQIPRGSGNEKEVSDYIAAFAKDLNLKYVQDPHNNLIIYKPGTPGKENAEPIILQGHLDMVCEKNAGTVHDFLKDPIKLYVDGDYIKADGTTLGADNGIAVAMCMALLEAGNLAHPPLEVVLTTDEETGMSGALNLDYGLLKGRRMANLDSGRAGGFVAGSAAGSTAEYSLTADWQAPGAFSEAYKLTIKGLHGGHSGGDIKLERGNAIRILGIVLSALEKAADIRIAEVGGGMKVNAIPREAWACVAAGPGSKDKLQSALDKSAHTLKDFFRVADPGLEIELLPTEATNRVLAECCGKSLIDSLLLLPNGVQAMSRDIDGLVAASNNMGVLETLDNAIKISCMPRGASREFTLYVEEKINALARLTGAAAKFIQRSPAWAFNPDSDILRMFAAYFTKINGREPAISAMHGGLETGIFFEKLPGIDIVSFGPNMEDLHTPEERLSISSTGKVWEFLCGVLGEM
ncbi:MAG: aminoacyl-histidine dipeptidase [Defluviitaleaceae bacterium]|nr:aminoacyl-histidine dipeptidase [Defluviitaleaceae bacterium]